ncbi:hypothetical protein LTR70_007000 [Exophiala xenobiotica]|uniref:Uncharacterized protein n=1 Tax=Lithohypha guttulata TaxID=1690604 RepID=A0ABR0K5Y9_9EURO|nr:hypothetical protein LTR24_006461 [Lithohypha guttulata]KAK5314886.1 hypothetical protein LTR70_007000 [Exophiala xenobiotica]
MEDAIPYDLHTDILAYLHDESVAGSAVANRLVTRPRTTRDEQVTIRSPSWLQNRRHSEAQVGGGHPPTGCSNTGKSFEANSNQCVMQQALEFLTRNVDYQYGSLNPDFVDKYAHEPEHW